MHRIVAATLLLGSAVAEASPTALRPLKTERLQFRAEVNALMRQGDYAKVEALAAELLEKDSRFSSGESKLEELYVTLTPRRGAETTVEKRHIDWFRQSPKSYLPKTGLSLVALRRAGLARGGGWADTVTPEQWKKFDERLKEADWWAQSALNDKPRDPQFFCYLIELCKWKGCPRATADALLARAIALNPNYDGAYAVMADYLLPRWHGSPEAVVEFASAASDQSQTLGNMVYARVAAVALLADGRQDGSAVRRMYPRLDWGRIRAGLLELDRRYPDSARTYHLLAHFARVYEDKETARAALLRLGRDWDRDGADYWFKELAFREAWDWAFGSSP